MKHTIIIIALFLLISCDSSTGYREDTSVNVEFAVDVSEDVFYYPSFWVHVGDGSGFPTPIRLFDVSNNVQNDKAISTFPTIDGLLWLRVGYDVKVNNEQIRIYDTLITNTDTVWNLTY